jgi:hypothetical protein
MIAVAAGARVLVATKPVDFRRGADNLAALVREHCGRTHSVGRCSSSDRSGHNARHSEYSLRFATIAYRWHPLFSRTVQVSPFRRSMDLTCIVHLYG